MMQTMLDQQRQANENQARLQAQAHEAQARLQEQMAKKDEDHAREMARLQTQLIDVLERRPEPIAVAPPGPAHHRGNDPNVLYERFRKRGPKEFAGTEDPMAADDWLEQIENIFEIFTCTGLERVQLTASMFTGLADSWWKTVRAEYRDMPDGQTWLIFKRQFGEKYIPSHIRRQRAAEFQQLV